MLISRCLLQLCHGNHLVTGGEHTGEKGTSSRSAATQPYWLRAAGEMMWLSLGRQPPAQVRQATRRSFLDPMSEMKDPALQPVTTQDLLAAAAAEQNARCLYSTFRKGLA